MRALVEAPWRPVGHWLQNDVGCLRYYISFMQEIIDSISVGELNSWSGKTATFSLFCSPSHVMLVDDIGKVCTIRLLEFREIITSWKEFIGRREMDSHQSSIQAYLRLSP